MHDDIVVPMRTETMSTPLQKPIRSRLHGKNSDNIETHSDFESYTEHNPLESLISEVIRIKCTGVISTLGSQSTRAASEEISQYLTSGEVICDKRLIGSPGAQLTDETDRCQNLFSSGNDRENGGTFEELEKISASSNSSSAGKWQDLPHGGVSAGSHVSGFYSARRFLNYPFVAPLRDKGFLSNIEKGRTIHSPKSELCEADQLVSVFQSSFVKKQLSKDFDSVVEFSQFLQSQSNTSGTLSSPVVKSCDVLPAWKQSIGNETEDAIATTCMYIPSNIGDVSRTSNMVPSQKQQSSMSADVLIKDVGMPRPVRESVLRSSVVNTETTSIPPENKELETTSLVELKKRYQLIEVYLQTNTSHDVMLKVLPELEEMQVTITQINHRHSYEREQLVNQIKRRRLSKADKKHLKIDLQDLGVRQKRLLAVVQKHRDVKNKVKIAIAEFNQSDNDSNILQKPLSQKKNNHDVESDRGAADEYSGPLLPVTPSRPYNTHSNQQTTLAHNASDIPVSLVGNGKCVQQANHLKEGCMTRKDTDAVQGSSLVVRQEQSFLLHSINDADNIKNTLRNAVKDPFKQVLSEQKNRIVNASQNDRNNGLRPVRQSDNCPLMMEASDFDGERNVKSVNSDTFRMRGSNASSKTTILDNDLQPNTCQELDRSQSNLCGTSCVPELDISNDQLQAVSCPRPTNGEHHYAYVDSQEDMFSKESSVYEFDKTAVDAFIIDTKKSESKMEDTLIGITIDIHREDCTSESLHRGTEGGNKGLDKEINLEWQHEGYVQPQNMSTNDMSEFKTVGGSSVGDQLLKRSRAANVRPHNYDVFVKKRKTGADEVKSCAIFQERGDILSKTAASPPQGGKSDHATSRRTHCIPIISTSVHTPDYDSLLTTPVSPLKGSSTDNSASILVPATIDAGQQKEQFCVPSHRTRSQGHFITSLDTVVTASEQVSVDEPVLNIGNKTAAFHSDGFSSEPETSTSKTSQVNDTSVHNVSKYLVQTTRNDDLPVSTKESNLPDKSRHCFMSPLSLLRSPLQEENAKLSTCSHAVHSPCSTAVSSDVFPVSCRELVRKMEAKSALAKHTKEKSIHLSESAGDYIAVPIGRVADIEKYGFLSKIPKEKCYGSTKYTCFQPPIPHGVNLTRCSKKNTDLAAMVEQGLLSPGENVLSVETKKKVFHGSLNERGIIIDSGGKRFHTPTAWYQQVTGEMVIKKRHAYRKVLYKGQPLSSFGSSHNTKSVDLQIISSPVGVERIRKQRFSDDSIRSMDKTTRSASCTYSTDAQIIDSLNASQTPESDTPMASLSTSDFVAARAVGESLQKVLAKCTIRLIDAAEIVHLPELDDKFWITDFKDVKMSKHLWQSVNCWT